MYPAWARSSMAEQWPFKPLAEGSSPSALILLFKQMEDLNKMLIYPFIEPKGYIINRVYREIGKPILRKPDEPLGIKGGRTLCAASFYPQP